MSCLRSTTSGGRRVSLRADPRRAGDDVRGRDDDVRPRDPAASLDAEPAGGSRDANDARPRAAHPRRLQSARVGRRRRRRRAGDRRERIDAVERAQNRARRRDLVQLLHDRRAEHLVAELRLAGDLRDHRREHPHDDEADRRTDEQAADRCRACRSGGRTKSALRSDAPANDATVWTTIAPIDRPDETGERRVRASSSRCAGDAARAARRSPRPAARPASESAVAISPRRKPPNADTAAIPSAIQSTRVTPATLEVGRDEPRAKRLRERPVRGARRRRRSSARARRRGGARTRAAGRAAAGGTSRRAARPDACRRRARRGPGVARAASRRRGAVRPEPLSVSALEDGRGDEDSGDARRSACARRRSARCARSLRPRPAPRARARRASATSACAGRARDGAPRSSSGLGSDPKRSSRRSIMFTCACASGVSSHAQLTGTPWRSRRLDHEAALRAREIRVVEHDARLAAAQRVVERVGDVASACRRARRDSAGRSRPRRSASAARDLPAPGMPIRRTTSPSRRAARLRTRRDGARRARATRRHRRACSLDGPCAGDGDDRRRDARAATRARPARATRRRGADVSSRRSRAIRRGPPSGECAITARPRSSQRATTPPRIARSS